MATAGAQGALQRRSHESSESRFASRAWRVDAGRRARPDIVANARDDGGHARTGQAFDRTDGGRTAVHRAAAKEIPARFATVAAAEKAGYFQYTPEDNTGAISYVNLKVWNSIDLDVPNQLWYDVNGRLLGVDYTVLQDQSPNAPTSLFGYNVDPARWLHRGAHMHYGYTMPDGSLKLGAMPVAKFQRAGGTLNATDPAIAANKAALVAAGLPGLTSSEPGEVRLPSPGDVGLGRLGVAEPRRRLGRRQSQCQTLQSDRDVTPQTIASRTGRGVPSP